MSKQLLTALLFATLIIQGCATNPFTTNAVDVPFIVSEINDNINSTPYVSDQLIWNQEDYWATPEEFYAKGAGDCEDYAIAKYFALRQAGIPAKQMLLTVGTIDNGEGLHMILLIKYKDTFVLDNIVQGVTPLGDYIDFEVAYKFNENDLYIKNNKMKATYLLKWETVMNRRIYEH